MEIGIIKSERHGEIAVVFTGEHYFFKSNFCGLIAIAKRDFEKESNSPTGSSYFDLYIGNNYIEDCATQQLAKRYIRRNENKYIKKNTLFKTKHVKLESMYLSVKVEGIGAREIMQ